MSRALHRPSALVAVLALGVAACSGGGDVEGVQAIDDGGRAEGSTLVAAVSGAPDQLDPHLTSAYPSFQVLENVYDTLVEPDAALEMQPALAESWETSDDGLTWTFRLREGVAFHDGSTFDADDVVYSLLRIRDEGQNGFRLEAVEDVVAVDPSTVELRLSRPAPDLLEQLGAFKGMAMVDEDFIESGQASTAANGTGPFRLATFDEATGAELVTNPDYWGAVPSIGGVQYRFVSETTTALTALRNQEVDWTDNVAPSQVDPLADEVGLTLESVPSTDYWYVAFNQGRAPFDDPDVRRALATAVDRDAVVEAALFGTATPNQSAVPVSSDLAFDGQEEPGGALSPFAFDPDAAREALAAAGAEDLSLSLLVTDEYPETIDVAQVLAAQWSDVGVDVSIETLDFSAWLDRQGQGDYDALLLGWLGNISYDDFYYAQHVTEGAFNYQLYSNPAVDDALEAARSAPDAAARRAGYEEAAAVIVDDVSYLYLYNPDVVHVWGDRVQGYEPRADRAIRWRDVRLDEG